MDYNWTPGGSTVFTPQGTGYASEDMVCGAPPPWGYFKFYLTSGIATAQATTSSVPVLYNPAVGGNPPVSVNNAVVPAGVVLKIMAVRIGVVSGTVTAGSILYATSTNITFSSTATTGASSFNSFVGRGNSTPAQFYTTATASAAPTVIFPSNLNAGGDLAAGALFTLIDYVNGPIALPPGASFWPLIADSASAPALTALVTIDVVQTPFISLTY
jgi:hypothetical protein